MKSKLVPQAVFAPGQEADGSGEICPRLDAHVVVLTNYLRVHHVVAFQELAKRVRKLTILISVSMEPDRDWDAIWGGLDVRVQKNRMLTRRWKHSSGFNEQNFVHVPYDTNAQLKSLKPDIVFSYEMGIRTLLSSRYRRSHRQVPLVLVGNMSEHIEKERGILRRTLRRLIRKRVDYFTYNGPSCQRYLQSLSIPDDKLFHLPYCIDPAAVFRGKRETNTDSESETLKLVYCGAMSPRKGILQFTQSLGRWCVNNPDRRVEFSIAGTGELRQSIADCGEPENLSITFLGNCDPAGLRTAYGSADICVFPSLADEWGLVPIEAMASGLPVLGSVFAQSVEAEVTDGRNGWIFDPHDSKSMDDAIGSALSCSRSKLIDMGADARRSVAHISPAATSEKYCQIISTLLPDAESSVSDSSEPQSIPPH